MDGGSPAPTPRSSHPHLRGLANYRGRAHDRDVSFSLRIFCFLRCKTTSSSLTQRTEKLADLPRQKLGLLQSGEMAALFHFGPSLDIAIGALGPRSRQMEEILGKLGIARRNSDPFTVGNEPGGMHPRIVRPERRADCACRPIEHDICKQVIAAYRILYCA